MNNKNIPTETGFYWAKSDVGYKWYNLIVNIFGEAPFLQWEAWNIVKKIVVKGVGSPEFIFGEKINEPEPEENR